MSEFSIQSVTDGKLCLHFLPLGWKILSMMEIFDFQHPENANIFMMLKNYGSVELNMTFHQSLTCGS
ncbi:hypothetical protein J4227_07130 [Candidatus Woesearchaeota archaeon]|nr:hypothetical protein [Candidatus Woesearchaeota archaeon]